MHNLSETSLKRDLGLIYQDAEELRSRLRKLKRLHHAVLDMDQKTISELRSYPKPPKPIHGVMAATFLLLGHKEGELKVFLLDFLFLSFKKKIECNISKTDAFS